VMRWSTPYQPALVKERGPASTEPVGEFEAA
jgi:hypothetical protein